MKNIALINRIKILTAVLVFTGASSFAAFADDQFSIAPSSHDNLVIFGPTGDRVAELTIPTISQAVTVGSTAFQISYGRDANNYVTAIIAPSSSQPQDLHFTVLNKTVEADKQAVVTLTFQDAKHVIIDPGYVGSVTVNSHLLRHRDLSDASAAPTQPPPQAMSPVVQPRIASPTVAQQEPPVIHHAPAPIVPKPIAQQMGSEIASNTPDAQSAPLPTADAPAPESQSPPLSGPPLLGSPLSQPPLGSSAKPPPPPSKKLYWAEPVTPPSGPAPVVGTNQMKLVAVHGPVTITTPGGETKTGIEGMLVPSGSSVSTGADGSAAVFMGGVDSARFLPNSQASITQKLDGSKRTTKVDLKVGTVFNRVGHRPGETQDYEVKTPQGIAAARGTSYAVCVTDTGGNVVTVVAADDGVVTLTDSSDGHQITITPLSNGSVSVGSVPAISASAIQAVVHSFLAAVQQFNTNVNAIVAAGQTGTSSSATNPTNTTDSAAVAAANQNYINSVTGFSANTEIYDAVNDSLITFDSTAETSSNQVDRNNAINIVVPPVNQGGLQQNLNPFNNNPLTPF